MRLVETKHTVVELLDGVRAFMDQDAPFDAELAAEMRRRQDDYAPVREYLTEVYRYLRQGADWTRVEVPECLKADARGKQPDEQATKATSSKKSATSLAAERRLSMSRGQSST